MLQHLFHQAGQDGGDPLVKAGDVGGVALRQVFEIEAHDDQFVPSNAPVVGTSQGLNSKNFHG